MDTKERGRNHALAHVLHKKLVEIHGHDTPEGKEHARYAAHHGSWSRALLDPKGGRENFHKAVAAAHETYAKEREHDKKRPVFSGTHKTFGSAALGGWAHRIGEELLKHHKENRVVHKRDSGLAHRHFIKAAAHHELASHHYGTATGHKDVGYNEEEAMKRGDHHAAMARHHETEGYKHHPVPMERRSPHNLPSDAARRSMRRSLHHTPKEKRLAALHRTIAD